MRTIRVFLCLLLLSLAGGRLYKLAQPRLVPSPEAPVLAALRKKLAQADVLRDRGEYQPAIDLFKAGYRDALRLRAPYFQVHLLVGMGQTHVAQHLYSEALRDFMAAREAMPSSGSTNSVIALNGSLATLYSKLGEYPS